MAGTERVYRVALFGVVGIGKSSIINLLANEKVADVSTNVEPCTRRARWYPITIGDRKFRLWDTMGFNPVEEKGINQLSPYEQAHSVLRNLPQGVDLILLCARMDRISASLRRLYWLLDSFFYGGQARVALVLTHLDTIPKEQQASWWDRNMGDIARKSGIPVQSPSLLHTCVTTVYDGTAQSDPLYQRSKQTLEALLEKVVGTNSTPFPLDFPPATAAENLRTHCQLSSPDAVALVEKLKLPQRRFNAVLFGEAGAGKSSVVNLLAGRQVAEVSDHMDSCTLDFSEHKIDAGSCQLRIWDTVGLNGRHSAEDDMSWKAMENAAKLIRSLHNEGGVDLLIFCKKYGRFTTSELDCFTLFYRFLCECKIPVSFVITHLEPGNLMTKWWAKNGKGLIEACGLKPSAIAGHACITSLSLDDDSVDQNLCDKLSLSRQLVQTMLEDAISYGDAFIKGQEPWMVSFLKKLAGIVGIGSLSKKATVQNLMERFGLSREHAEELIRLLSPQV